MPRANSIVGRRFGRLVAIERLPCSGRAAPVRVQCDCGAQRTVLASNLYTGRTRSCGCLHRESRSTHRMARVPEYAVWSAMKQRCNDATLAVWQRYGGRGIYVCPRWSDDFAAFYADMGPRPAGLTIDRVNNDGSYTCGKCDDCIARGAPMNCRWTDHATQSRNRRSNVWVVVGGERRLASDVCREHGVTKQTLHCRIRLGWDVYTAATTPPNPRAVAAGRRVRLAALARRTESP